MTESPNFENLRSEILTIHKKFIDAHLNKNIEFFVQNMSEDYMSVSNGEIRTQTAEEIRLQMTNYLNNTVFSEYKNLREPIIEFSKDGSIAWAIFQIKVKGRRTMDDGSERDLDFICAYSSLFERQDDKWIRLWDVSTFK
ncbi:MAG: nuclear transport factor 2 family protein [Promethearchaeota archaeon]